MSEPNDLAARTAVVTSLRDLEDRVAALEAEVARLSQPEPDAEFIKRLERVFPVLVQRQDSRAVKNMPGVARPAYPV